MSEGNLGRTLSELGLSEDEQSTVRPALVALARWTANPTPTETHDLVQRLSSMLPAPVPVRTAARARAGLTDELEYMIRVAASQTTVLHAGFWIGSLVVIAIGSLVAATQQDGSRSVALLLSGPLLAYLGAAVGFRAESLGVLEFEFACPITPRQLTLARLGVIVGYQTVAGMVMSVVFAAAIGTTVQHLVAIWLAPLLLGTGVTLICSLRFPIVWAGAAVYAGWIGLVVLAWRFDWITSAASLPVEVTVAVTGLAAIGAAVWWLPAAIPSILDRQRLSAA
jgi:hypothetical protein